MKFLISDIYYQYSDILLALAIAQDSYLTLTPIIINVTLCIFWPVSIAHMLVPFVHRLVVRHDDISFWELFGRDVGEYPWSNSEDMQIELVAEENERSIQGRSFTERC
jgi:hypothetical protein